jgi:hypothetical protein
VDPVTLAVTLSNFLIFADDSTFGTSMTITALTATKYLAVSYISAAIASTPAGVTSVVIDAFTYQNGTLGARLFGKKSIFAGSMPTSVIRATALDANNVVVAYSDTKTNNGITCVALSINSYTGTIIYGSVLSVTTGGFTADNLPYNPTGQLDINLVTIKAGSQFMLMFSDLSLNGALVAVVGEVCATHFILTPIYLIQKCILTTSSTICNFPSCHLQRVQTMLVRASPNYVLNEGIATVNNMHSYVSLAVSKSSAAVTTVAIMSAVADFKCDTTVSPM